MRAELFFDLGSPYAWLAAERAPALLAPASDDRLEDAAAALAAA